MQLRWTAAAADDLEGIAEYLFEKSSRTAPQLIRKIYEAPSNLKNYPNLGRLGKKDGTRELVLAPLPYVIVYLTERRGRVCPEDFARSSRLAALKL